ncbi:ATP-binding cassette domain-containing protein [Massilibacterium senegalense]|uniref:ATP-binding cassette domain-containing protein n=1 Tax=Massilibacterium senegalense TaxID=1632858 RepID=UPI00078092C4|nr:ATP-binding cassette domain-containing protein [Massilibacterium senegalense]
MYIFALIGPSGTGKSTVAKNIAKKYHIPAIIDDGLLIINGKKIAGTSAKYEKTKLAAVKRAIFFYEDHQKEVINALRQYPITRLLILGTSEKMIKRIVEALKLPGIQKIFTIDSVLSEEEIAAAKFSRSVEGFHTIPISSTQIDEHFYTQLLTKVMTIFSPKKGNIGKQTIVHPSFHRDRITIENQVIRDYILHFSRPTPFVQEVLSVTIKRNGFYVINIQLHCTIRLLQNLMDDITSWHRELVELLKKMVGIPILHCNLEIHKVTILGQ